MILCVRLEISAPKVSRLGQGVRIMKFDEITDSELGRLYNKERIRAVKEEFTTTYSVREKPSPYVCPLCTAYLSVGRMYERTDMPNVFTCNKCRMTFRIECTDKPNDELFTEIADEKRKKREEKKARKNFPLGKV